MILATVDLIALVDIIKILMNPTCSHSKNPDVLYQIK